MKGPRAIIPVLPSALTLGNAVCGFVAMAKTVDAMTASGQTGPLDPLFAEKILDAVWFVILGMVFDALDGRIARLTGQTSAIGEQLDSLADVVTFGVAPALMAKVVYEHAKTALDQPFAPKVVTVLCVVYLIGAVLRLARFTVGTDADEESHHTFEGLPSPAAAALVVTMCLFVFEGRSEVGLSEAAAGALATWCVRLLPFVAAGLGLLMVSRVPYVHVVQRYIGTRTRRATFVNMVIVGVVVGLFHGWSLFVVALAYVVGGVVLAVRSRLTGRGVLESLPPPWDPDDDEPDEDAWTRDEHTAGNGRRLPR